MSENENKYLEMPKDVLLEHAKQLKEAAGTKIVDLTQCFGAPKTEDELQKLKDYESVSAKVVELSKDAATKELTDNEVVLAQASIDRAVSDIRKIDPDAPLEAILSSKFNNLDKLAILGGYQPVVEHYTAAISTIKTELGKKTSTSQGFAAPETGDETAASIIESMLPKEA